MNNKRTAKMAWLLSGDDNTSRNQRQHPDLGEDISRGEGHMNYDIWLSIAQEFRDLDGIFCLVESFTAQRV